MFGVSETKKLREKNMIDFSRDNLNLWSEVDAFSACVGLLMNEKARICVRKYELVSYKLLGAYENRNPQIGAVACSASLNNESRRTRNEL